MGANISGKSGEKSNSATLMHSSPVLHCFETGTVAGGAVYDRMHKDLHDVCQFCLLNLTQISYISIQIFITDVKCNRLR